jgi:hypothetical protein
VEELRAKLVVDLFDLSRCVYFAPERPEPFPDSILKMVQSNGGDVIMSIPALPPGKPSKIETWCESHQVPCSWDSPATGKWTALLGQTKPPSLIDL